MSRRVNYHDADRNFVVSPPLERQLHPPLRTPVGVRDWASSPHGENRPDILNDHLEGNMSGQRPWQRAVWCVAAGVLFAVPATVPAQPAAPNQNLEQTLQWLYEARKFHAGLRDYSCYLIKQERVRGVLLPENFIAFKFKPQPFSVHMKWMAPAELKDQEVAFQQGYNNNKMRVHPKVKGFGKNLLGFVTIDPTDPRVLEHSRHTIFEAGLGNSIEQLIRNLEAERQLNKINVQIAEYGYDKRKCFRVEATRTEYRKEAYCYRSVIYIDQEHKLPIRLENYEWPTQGGAAGGEVMEVFSYVSLEFNRGIPDAQFRK
jgi:hypothetical protein